MLFCWLAAFFSVKGQTSPLIYVVESFRPAIASEYKLAQANKAYKQFSFQLVDISKLDLNSNIKKFSYSFICGKGYSPPFGRE